MSGTTPSTAARNRAPDRRELVTVKQFAAACRVSTAQVRRWIAAGFLTEYRLRTARTGRTTKYSEIRLDLNERDFVVPTTKVREPV